MGLTTKIKSGILVIEQKKCPSWTGNKKIHQPE